MFGTLTLIHQKSAPASEMKSCQHIGIKADPDVLVLTEYWLKESVSDSNIYIYIYKLCF